MNNNYSESNKIVEPNVILITGSARRIGAGIADYLHQRGFNIIIHYRHSEAEAKQLYAKLDNRRKNSVVLCKADLSDVAAINLLIKNITGHWGRLDVVINNASSFYPTPIGTVTEYQWQDLLDSNLKAPFFLAQAASPYLNKQQGCIINIADIHAERPLGNYSVYSIAKAGLVMLTKALAKELAPSIRVNAISPGNILWPEGENTLTEGMQQQLIDRTLLQKAGTVDEIAEAVLFLMTHSHITGQVLTIDGGRSLRG